MQLPESLLAKIGPIISFDRPAQGENSDVTLVAARAGRFALKRAVTEKQAATVAAESRILAAIGHEYPFVPAPVASAPGLLLMTWLPGQDMTALNPDEAPGTGATSAALPGVTAADRHRLLAEAAAALRRIHGWRPDLPPPPAAMLDMIVAQGYEPDIVFAHGDYCLPNIMVNDSRISAVIDWPHAGYSDRRVDLSAAVWSIRWNFKDESYVDTFLSAYGFSDKEVLPFFHKVYDLFS
ncbi:MAG TPA: phosphotransferase [Symbiobacteriaceae bacterium]|nr:phosphotransferase [Symbiobacteriaceae bacterium]